MTHGRANDEGKITGPAILWLGCLLGLPIFALYRLGIDLVWSAAYALLIGLVSYGAYAVDKRRARENAWRVSEARLHLTELLGGWPGAFLAQRHLRHKCSKVSYQVVFWMIVLAYQFAAVDALQKWKFSRAGLEYFDRQKRAATMDGR